VSAGAAAEATDRVNEGHEKAAQCAACHGPNGLAAWGTGALKVRHALDLDSVPARRTKANEDSIVQHLSADPASGRMQSASGYGHPTCSPRATTIADGLSETLPRREPALGSVWLALGCGEFRAGRRLRESRKKREDPKHSRCPRSRAPHWKTRLVQQLWFACPANGCQPAAVQTLPRSARAWR
jgi:hypothetical protein